MLEEKKGFAYIGGMLYNRIRRFSKVSKNATQENLSLIQKNAKAFFRVYSRRSKDD